MLAIEGVWGASWIRLLEMHARLVGLVASQRVETEGEMDAGRRLARRQHALQGFPRLIRLRASDLDGGQQPIQQP